MALSLTPALPQHFFHPNTRSAHRAPAAGRRRGLNRAGRQRLAHSLHALVAFVTLFPLLFPLGRLVTTADAAEPQARAHR